MNCLFHPFSFLNFCHCYSLWRINAKTSYYQIFELIRNIWCKWWRLYLFEKTMFEISFTSTILAWCASLNKFIKHHTKSPNISFWSICVVNITLWGHINGRANTYILELIAKYKKKYSAIWANPKSAILYTPWEINMFEILISRWTMCFLDRYFSP